MSNADHNGPHCNGSCEGMAYTIEIRQQAKKIAELEAALQDIANCPKGWPNADDIIGYLVAKAEKALEVEE